MKQTRETANWFILIYQYIVFSLLFLCVVLLIFIVFKSTTILVPDSSGGHFFLPDSTFHNLLVILLFFAACILARKIPVVSQFISRLETDEHFFKQSRRTILFVTGIMALIWVLSTQFVPSSDQLKIQKGVYDLHIQDWSLFLEGEYFYRYPNQYGLLLLSYVFSFLFGSQNYVLFQFMNVAGLLLFLWGLSEICECFGFRRTVQLGVSLEGLVFFPLILYCSYIYGTILGIAFSVLALRSECRFLQRGRFRDAWLSAGFILFAMLIKSNFMIYMIGMIIYALVELIRHRKPAIIVFVFLICISGLFVSFAPRMALEHITGLSLNQPMSSWSWIAMGLSDGRRAPGAWNDLGLYEQAGFRTYEHGILSKQLIKDRVLYFLDNKGDALRFFTQKLAYEWNDPTFQSFWSLRMLKAQINQSSLIWSLVNTNNAYYAAHILNYIQAIHLAGVFFYCILFCREQKICLSILPLIFIGGFIFYIFWEAGPRYTVLFYVLLFPLAFAGYDRLLQCAFVAVSDDKTQQPARRNTIYMQLRCSMPLLCITAVCFIILSGVYAGGRINSLMSDADRYQEYLDALDDSQVLPDGQYILTASNGLSLELNNDESADSGLILGKEPTSFLLHYYQGVTRISIPQNNCCLAAQSNNTDLLTLSAESFSDDESQKWFIKRGEEGNVYILTCARDALTYDVDSGHVYIAPFTWDSSQLWNVS